MNVRRSTWAGAVAVAALLAAVPLAVAARPSGPHGTPAPATTGVPVGGPDVLSAPPTDIPEVQNHDPRFRAPYEMVSGSERYVDGEYLFTDFIYDDGDTTYPADFGRYGNNAGDLFEYRMSVRGGDLAVRLSLTTLLAPDSTIAVVAFDSDRNPATGSSTLPRDPGLPFPGTDAVLTTWGTGGEWSTWTGTSWQTVAVATKADLEANQITVTVPEDVARPTGQWASTLATGLYDPTTGGWLAPGNVVRVPHRQPRLPLRRRRPRLAVPGADARAHAHLLCARPGLRRAPCPRRPRRHPDRRDDLPDLRQPPGVGRVHLRDHARARTSASTPARASSPGRSERTTCLRSSPTRSTSRPATTRRARPH